MLVVGVAVLGTSGAEIGSGLWSQNHLNSSWVHYERDHPNTMRTAPLEPDASLLHPVDGVDFAIRVPRLDYFAAVREGVDANVLAGGPGHYPEMAWPGQTGNVAVAAHNVYWIAFDQLHDGDIVKLETRWGLYEYRITDRRVVQPDDRTILVPTTDHRLTLTTCWPLWAGALATERLIFTAVQVSPSPAGGKVIVS